MTNETPILNEHNKQEYPPMHADAFDTYPLVLQSKLFLNSLNSTD